MDPLYKKFVFLIGFLQQDAYACSFTAMTTEGIFVDFFHTHLSINNVHLNYGLVVAQYVIRS